MRYVGGKTQIAKVLATEVNRYRDGLPFLDPFCGSLAMTLALGGDGIATDTHPALIGLYLALQRGWEPPGVLSREEWEVAKTLPDTDPLKGFAGFACSFRGIYFSGYAGGYVGPVSNHGAFAARKVLLRDFALLAKRKVKIGRKDFLTIPPSGKFALYLDPPYRGTVGYNGTPALDYDAFYARVEAWAAFRPVCVSEYEFPLGQVVWTRERALKLGKSFETRTEKLFLVGGRPSQRKA